jgi:radical SAM-linked protein
MKWQHLEASSLESVLSRGDRSLAAVIERAWRGGARFDSWTEGLEPARWESAFRDESVDPRLFSGKWGPDDPLPWDFIDTGVSRKYLRRERTKAFREETTEDCRGGACQGCGIAGAPRDNRLAAPFSTDFHISPEVGVRPGPCLHRTLRIRYCVTGMARFLSHLERANVLRRALARTSLAPVYSSGFSPRAKAALGPPLPVGIASMAELVDFQIGDPRSLEILRGEIAVGFCEGMGLEELWLDFPECFAPLSAIVAARYEFNFSSAADAAWDRAMERYREYAGREKVPKRTQAGAPDRERDLKPAILRFAPHEERRAFEVTVNCNDPSGRNAGPRDMLESVFLFSPNEFHLVDVVRTGYLDGRGAPFAAGPNEL